MLSLGLAFCPCQPLHSQPARMHRESPDSTSTSQLVSSAHPCLKAHRSAVIIIISSSNNWPSSALSRHSCLQPGRVRLRVSPAGAEQPSSGSRSSSGGSSSSSERPCPLHACLLQHGITNLAAFNAPKHLALSQAAVSSNVEPKLAALATEGLSPKQVAQLLGQKGTSLFACSYKDVFQPNLQLLQQKGHMLTTSRTPKPHISPQQGSFLCRHQRLLPNTCRATPARCSSCCSGLRAAWELGWNS